MSTGYAAGVTGVRESVQVKTQIVTGGRRHLQCGHAIAASLLALLGGCASTSLSPIDWWHDLEGGSIAQTRPPPPNVDAPYPNLSSVPTRPQATDAAARGRIAGALVADRANAQYGAAQAPLDLPAASRQVTPPSADTSISASLQAASAPPLPPGAQQSGAQQPGAQQSGAAPRRAPVGAVETAALPPPAAPEPGPMPDIPAVPPAPPSIGGVPTMVVPTPPRPTPPSAPAAVATPPGAPVAVPFAAGSAVLSPQAQAPLKALAQARAGAAIAVIGYGEANGADADAQVAAMPLAWQRAEAISGALQLAGVPADSLRIAAEAVGRGGVARIAN